MVESEELPTIADDLVVTKYKMSAEIVNSKDIQYWSCIDLCKALHASQEMQSSFEKKQIKYNFLIYINM